MHNIQKECGMDNFKVIYKILRYLENGIIEVLPR
nr:MAG TPA: hypothetical protein [Caudoviricetes sp.]